MRKFLKILGGIAVLGAIIVAFVFWLTSGIADAGNAFVAKLRSGEPKAAYEMTSAAFRKATRLEVFQQYVARANLKGAGEPSWSSRKINGAGESAIGTLSGSIKDAKGNSMPVRLTLTKKDGTWVIHHMLFTPAGLAAGTHAVPGEKELIKLAHNANFAFTRSVEAKDFKGFYDFISERWRKRTNPEELKKAFRAFIEKDARFGNFSAQTPAFDGPARVVDRRVLRVTGFYETRPLRIAFKHSYIREGLSWKLIGFNFSMKPPAKPKSGP